MPNRRDTSGLTKGDDRALAALNVERLAPDEVSKVIRVRAKAWVIERLAGLSAKEIGHLLEQALR
jgi:hypothetical protein